MPRTPPPVTPVNGLSSEADTDAALAEKRRYICEREIIIARAEKRIAALTAETTAATRPFDEKIARLSISIDAFVDANPKLFAARRKRQTADGWYGLVPVGGLEVTNEDAAIAAVRALGWHECVKTTVKLLSSPLRKRLKGGAHRIPGCRLNLRHAPKNEIKAALIEEARLNA